MRRTPAPPLPAPLSGSETGSFAQNTVTVRLPELGRLALAENTFLPEVVARVHDLLAEIPTASIRPLNDPGGPDEADWAGYIASHAGKNWLEVPWFFAETYFYRRLLEATGYFQPGPTQGLDPFAGQKRLVFEVSQPVIRALAALLNTQLRALPVDHPSRVQQMHHDLIRLLVLNLWGNQADLSMWPAGQGERPDHQDDTAQQAHLLDNDSAALADYLLSLERPARVDFIMDNAGLELVHDLALADYLLTSRVAERVNMHLKSHPTYVSDALPADVRRMVKLLASDADAEVRFLAYRLEGHLETGDLRLLEDFFWTSPLSFWEMPERLRGELSHADLLISKGDANYRRLLGDRHWPPTTPVATVLSYVPAPLIALRVLKAEIVIGLRPDQVEFLNRTDPTWRFNGHWGVIQFSSGS